MNRLPDRSNLDHLKKQAKDLIRLYRNRDAEAIARFRRALPAATGRSDDEIGVAQTPSARCAIMRGARIRFRILGGPAEVCRSAIGVPRRSGSPRASLAQARVFRGGRGRRPIAKIPASPFGCCSKIRISRPADPISHVRSVTKARCGTPRRPIPHGSTVPAGRCRCRRCSRSPIRVCCRCRSFANAFIAARAFCSPPARTPISGSAIAGRPGP